MLLPFTVHFSFTASKSFMLAITEIMLQFLGDTLAAHMNLNLTRCRLQPQTLCGIRRHSMTSYTLLFCFEIKWSWMTLNSRFMWRRNFEAETSRGQVTLLVSYGCVSASAPSVTGYSLQVGRRPVSEVPPPSSVQRQVGMFHFSQCTSSVLHCCFDVIHRSSVFTDSQEVNNDEREPDVRHTFDMSMISFQLHFLHML